MKCIKFDGTHLYTWVERGTVRVRCLAQEHNTMSPARARTQTAQSGDQRASHEATAPAMGCDLRLSKASTLLGQQHWPESLSEVVVRNKAYKQIRWSCKYKTKQNNMEHESTLELHTDWSDLILYNSEGSNTNSSSNNKIWYGLPVTVTVNVTVRSLAIRGKSVGRFFICITVYRVRTLFQKQISRTFPRLKYIFQGL